MSSSCCRAPVGADMRFFESLSAALAELEARGLDKIIMDFSVSSKKAVYDRLLAQAAKISSLRGSDG